MQILMNVKKANQVWMFLCRPNSHVVMYISHVETFIHMWTKPLTCVMASSHVTFYFHMWSFLFTCDRSQLHVRMWENLEFTWEVSDFRWFFCAMFSVFHKSMWKKADDMLKCVKMLESHVKMQISLFMCHVLFSHVEILIHMWAKATYYVIHMWKCKCLMWKFILFMRISQTCKNSQ